MTGREGDDIAERSRRSYGPAIGYISSAVDLIFTIHAVAEQKEEARTLRGAGYQFDVGKRFPLTPHFGLGPRLSYKSFRYTHETVDGATSRLREPVTLQIIEPVFALIFEF